jgi:nitroreductase
MEFYDVIKTRRSIRSYMGTPIPDEALTRVLEAVRMAPSGHNRQSLKFYVVEESEKNEKIAEACSGQKWIAEAPMVIVAVGWKFPSNRGGYIGEMSFTMDVCIAFTHLILAARAEGLGTCWIGDFSNYKVKEILELPEEENVVAITPMGYPDKVVFTENTTRKSLEEIVERV